MNFQLYPQPIISSSTHLEDADRELLGSYGYKSMWIAPNYIHFTQLTSPI